MPIYSWMRVPRNPSIRRHGTWSYRSRSSGENCFPDHLKVTDDRILKHKGVVKGRSPPLPCRRGNRGRHRATPPHEQQSQRVVGCLHRAREPGEESRPGDRGWPNALWGVVSVKGSVSLRPLIHFDSLCLWGRSHSGLASQDWLHKTERTLKPPAPPPSADRRPPPTPLAAPPKDPRPR